MIPGENKNRNYLKVVASGVWDEGREKNGEKALSFHFVSFAIVPITWMHYKQKLSYI